MLNSEFSIPIRKRRHTPRRRPLGSELRIQELSIGQILQSLLLTDEIRSIIDAETDFRIAYF